MTQTILFAARFWTNRNMFIIKYRRTLSVFFYITITEPKFETLRLNQNTLQAFFSFPGKFHWRPVWLFEYKNLHFYSEPHLIFRHEFYAPKSTIIQSIDPQKFIYLLDNVRIILSLRLDSPWLCSHRAQSRYWARHSQHTLHHCITPLCTTGVPLQVHVLPHSHLLFY